MFKTIRTNHIIHQNISIVVLKLTHNSPLFINPNKRALHIFEKCVVENKCYWANLDTQTPSSHSDFIYIIPAKHA